MKFAILTLLTVCYGFSPPNLSAVRHLTLFPRGIDKAQAVADSKRRVQALQEDGKRQNAMIHSLSRQVLGAVQADQTAEHRLVLSHLSNQMQVLGGLDFQTQGQLRGLDGLSKMADSSQNVQFRAPEASKGPNSAGGPSNSPSSGSLSNSPSRDSSAIGTPSAHPRIPSRGTTDHSSDPSISSVSRSGKRQGEVLTREDQLQVTSPSRNRPRKQRNPSRVVLPESKPGNKGRRKNSIQDEPRQPLRPVVLGNWEAFSSGSSAAKPDRVAKSVPTLQSKSGNSAKSKNPLIMYGRTAGTWPGTKLQTKGSGKS